ncbi:MAG: hypothetical protein JST68_01825, partial [Bacteroidetes bacterium]|nr:hypothetical protein [Bacteroidota bacterium]
EDVVLTTYALLNLCFNCFQNGNLSEVEKYLALLDKTDDQMPDKQIIADIYKAK